MFVLFFAIVLSIYGSMNFLIAKVFVNQFPNYRVIIYIVVFLFALSSLLTMILRDQSTGKYIGIIGTYWMAISFLGFIVYGIFALIPKETFYLSTTILLTLLIIGIYSANSLKQTNYQISLANKVGDLDIVLISDLHLGYVNGANKLEKIVNKVNELNPDIVLIAGDLFDSNIHAISNIEKVKKELNAFKTTYGTYLAWGNHDAGENFQKMKELIEETNIVLLEDEVIDVGPFLVVGRRDIQPIGDQGEQRLPIDEVLKGIELDKPVFLMDHQPTEISDYDERIDLVVSGHTHRGQIFPFNFITKAIFPIDYGIMKKENNTYAVVTSGAGFWGPPIRIGTKSEIVLIEVR